ncbi:MAG: universal stress protein [Bacteroidetes bacterium]|nr:universal stress protein [Bacteroidota bacterium]
MYTFDRILCPTDFSDASLQAVQFAAFLAGREHGHIKLLYVDENEKDPLGFFNFDEHREKEYRGAITTFAEQKFSEISKRAGLDPKVLSTHIHFGTAYHEIIQEAETNRFAAVVISTEGLGRSSPHMLGRTVERVVRLCRTPVISIRPNEKGPEWKISTILCPTDFSEYANYAIPYAVSIARRHKAKIIFLHIVDLTVQHPELLVQNFPDLSIYHEHSGEIQVEKIVGRDIEPENSIVRIAEEYQADLIIMGTHGARGMRRVQIGNTTEEVVRRSIAPVLTITHPVHKTVFPHRFSKDYNA